MLLCEQKVQAIEATINNDSEKLKIVYHFNGS